MSSTGSGYDYSCGTFSPDGRIFQVEYAQKAVENSGTAIGIKCIDGVVVAVGKSQVSKMLVPGSNRRVFGVDSHTGIAVTGFAADGRQIVSRAREEAQSYRDTYGHGIVPSVLNNRLSLYMHYFTLYGSLRPFGAAVLLAGYDEDLKSAELYMMEPSGAAYRYHACSAGKGANAAKTELEKLLNKYGTNGLTVNEAISDIAKILHVIRDPSKDKPLEIEMGWICSQSHYKYELVPRDIVLQADKAAQAIVEGLPPPPTTSDSDAVMEEKSEMEIVE